MKLDVSDITALQPVIAAAVRSALDQIADRESMLGTSLAYTEPQAAALLNIRPTVLAGMRRDGKLRAVRAGKRWLYPRASLIQYLEK